MEFTKQTISLELSKFLVFKLNCLIVKNSEFMETLSDSDSALAREYYSYIMGLIANLRAAGFVCISAKKASRIFTHPYLPIKYTIRFT